MEADEEHRRPLTGGSRTPPGDKNNGVAVNARSADGTATPEPMSLGLATPGRGPALDAQLIPDPGKAAPPALPPRPRVPPRPASMVAPARGRSGTGGCGLCWRGGGGLRKYVFLCAACGSLSSLLGILFLAVYFLLRSYTSSLVYFETVPTYVPASMLLSTGLVVMCLARRRNRYSFLMKLCGCACLASAALCVLVTVATTVVHMSRLQSLSQCHYQQRTQTCTCYSALVDGTATEATDEGARYVFNAIPDCDVIHGALYSCLRAMFGLSVVGILVCIFSGMLVYQLFSHEKKKMYWEQLELRCRYLYRRQQTQPAGQPLAHTPMAHHCGRCSCCDDCRDLHTPPPSIPWEFIDSRYWAPGRVGNLYSPSPEDHVAAPRPGGGAAARPGSTAASGSAWSWRRLPWARSSGGGGAVGASSGSSVARADGSLCGLRAQNAPSPDSQYGFGALGQLGPLGRDPSVGPYLLSQVYPTPQPHPRPFAPGPVPGMPMPLTVPMPLGMADDLGPQFYLWGPPPPYMSNPASAANSPARRDPVLPAASTPLTAASARTALRTHLCSPVVTAVPVTSASVEDAGSTSAMDSLSSPEKTVPRKKRKKALASSESPVDAGLDGEGLPPPDSPESPTPSPVTPATAPGPAAGVRKTKKRSDACVMPGGRHAARYSHRTRSSQHSHSSRRPASADSCCPERPCQRATVPDSDDVDTEGYSYPRLKFPPPQAPIASSAAPACDSQAILAAFDNQAFQDAASDCQPCPAGTLSNPGGPVKTLTLGPQGPLVCKKRPSDLSESEVYFGDDSSCCNVSEPHSSLTYDEGRELRELRAFKLVHTHAQQRSMDAALPMRPVSMHGPSASTLSDTAVADPHYRLHPLSVDPAQSGRQRMPLPIPQASLAPDLQYESIADSNVYTYIIGPAGPPARRSCKANCDSALAPPVSAASRLERPEPSSDDKQNAANVQRESAVTAGAQEPGVCLSEEL